MLFIQAARARLVAPAALFALTSLPSSFAASPAPQDVDWKAFPLPSIVRATPASEGPLEIPDGIHLRGLDRDLRREAPSQPPLSVSTLRQLLEQRARDRDLDLMVDTGPDVLFVRGNAEALGTVEQALAALDALDRALTIELEVTLTPASGEPRRWSTRARSGERVGLGTRRYESYLADYDVNVAADTGVAEPDTALARTGHVVHVTASRVARGSAVQMEVHLDLSETLEVATFEPGTLDLGVLEQPLIGVFEVVFSTRVASGQSRVVTLAGLPLSSRDWTLEVRATSRPDPEPSAALGWVALDLGFAARRPAPSARFGLGDGLGRDSDIPSDPTPTLAAGTLASLISDGVLAQSAPLWSETLLFLPTGEDALHERARGLVAGIEAVGGSESEILVRAADVSAGIPSTAGSRVRLIVGREFVRVTDYRTQLAPQSWMPQPQVARFFDGFALDARLGGGANATLSGSAWSSSARDGEPIDEKDVGVATLQRVTRALSGGAFEVPSGQDVVALPASDSGPQLRVELRAR